MKQKKRIILLLVLLFAAALIGANHRAISLIRNNLTTRQISLPDTASWSGGKAYLQVPYSDVSETDYLNLYVPDAETPPPLLVLIHGGGFIFGDPETGQIQYMYDYFRDHGYACATVNYRLAQEAPFPGAVDDCKAAIRFLRANADFYGYNADSITVFGESAGGYLALMCAVTTDEDFHGVPYIGQEEASPVSADVSVLVDYYGYTSLTGLKEDLKEIGVPKIVFTFANSWTFGNLMGYEDFGSAFFRKNISEMTEEEREEKDPYYYLEKNRTELAARLSAYLIHGDSDMTIPLPSSVRLQRALAEVLGEEKVFFRIEPGMGHASDPLYATPILEEIDAFIRSSNGK